MIIRRLPEDFQVDEQPSPTWTATIRPAPAAGSAKPHAVYHLTKTSLATPEAIGRLAAQLRVKPSEVSYAGLKDKHARTRQYVTAPAPSAARTAELAPPTPTALSGPGWSAERVGFVAAPIDASCIDGNHFDIVIREIQRQELAQMARRAESLAASHADQPVLLVINYFGDQRFGSARHGAGFAGSHLVRGDFESALRLLIATPARKDTGARRTFTRAAAQQWGRWSDLLPQLPGLPERRAIEVLASGGSFRDAYLTLPNFTQVMAIEALQSHLWNATARAMVIAECARSGIQAIHAADEFGDMLFPPAAHVPHDWLTLSIPMPAAGVVPSPPWGEAMVQAIAAEGLDLETLTIPGVRRPNFGTALRPLVVPARSFQLGAPEPDELSKAKPRRFKRRVRFSLPRGAYATVVLRALGQT